MYYKFPQILTIGPTVDAKDLDPDFEHEKSVPTVEALLALNKISPHFYTGLCISLKSVDLVYCFVHLCRN